ncbi:MAG TPA: glycosyltransferase family 39 protein [Candidatus Krumholzibacteria bacterium]|nr:glycosyltransferase family 39 protein [Candidatus Krumholzibacteria bacterium]
MAFQSLSVRQRALLIGVVALAARAFYIAIAGRHFDVTAPGDHVAYTEFARLMLSGPGWFSYPLAVREPLYPAFMAVAYALPGGDFGSLQILQALLGAATASWLYLGLRRFTGERVALLSGAMFALHPHFVPFTADPLRENLIIPLVVGFVVSFLAAMERPARTRLFVHALFIVLLAHTDVRFLPLAAVFPFMAFAAHRGVARSLRETLWVALFAVLMMIPYQARCYIAMGHPVIVTERFFGRWLPRAGVVTGNAVEEHGSRESWLADWERKKRESLATLTPGERAFFESGSRPLLAHRAVHLYLFNEYWRFARLAPSYRPYPDGRFEPGWSLRHNATSSLVMVPFFLLLPVFFWLAGPAERRIAVPLLGYLVAHNIMHVLVHARERYRIPLEVITGLVVAMALVLLWDRFVSGKNSNSSARS